MASIAAGRRYLPEELFDLRIAVSPPSVVFEKLNAHPDIFPAHKAGVVGKDNNRTFDNPSNSLFEITNRQNAEINTRAERSSSEQESESYHLGENNNIREQRHVHWSLRKRDSSERSSQPYSAPTDIAAQQSENFQRFYRAVVSPTHVRVTAGGRIVPNTRASAPPLFDWNGDKFHPGPKITLLNHVLHPSYINPSSQAASLPSGYSPSVPGGFPPTYNLPPGNASTVLSNMSSQVQPGSGGDLGVSNTKRSPRMNGETNANMSHVDTTASPQPIKISHPSQFDHTKPFTFNGHVVYPLPQGFQPPQSMVPMPISMLGSSMALATPHTAAQGSGYRPTQLPALANPFMFQQPGPQLPVLMPYPSFASENHTSMAQIMQTGTVPGSAHLRAQVELLHSQLRTTEEAITTRSNPMGEALMMQHHSILSSQLSTLERLLQSQLAQEQLVNKDFVSGQEYTPTTMEQHFARTEQPLLAQKKPPPKIPEIDGHGNKLNAASDSTPDSSKLEPETKSRLTLAAALAPPFKPRAKSVATSATNGIISSTAPPDVDCFLRSSETEEQIMNRLLSKSDTNWGQSSIFRTNDTKTIGLPRARTFHESSTEPQTEVPPPSYQRSNTYHGTSSGLNSEVAPMQAVPYLVGTLPRGIPATMVTPNDINYSRPLTDDEIRARYLYWGKAPRAVQSGLPKFDGKDFYPPSPVKESLLMSSNSPHVSTLVDPSGTPARLDFSTLFDGYKTPSPLHRLHLQNMPPLLPITQPVFENSTTSVHQPSTGSADLASSVTGTEESPVAHQSFPAGLALVQHNGAASEDFSNLFVTKSPSPIQFQITSPSCRRYDQKEKSPQTPDSSKGRVNKVDEKVDSQDSWGLNSRETNEPTMHTPEIFDNDQLSPETSVEFHLSPRGKTPTFAQRVENFRTADQQSAFLQNMLRLQPLTTTSALSGAITAANAQGFLPQYRGSAAASLAPTKANVSAMNIDSSHESLQSSTGKTAARALSPLVVSSQMLENQPLGKDISYDGLGSENLGAEGYMRYIAKKDDKKKRLEASLASSGGAETSWQLSI